MLAALLAFSCWQAVLFASAIALVGTLGRSAEERCLLILGVEITLESSVAGLFSFTRANSPAAYWIAAFLLAAAVAAWPAGRRALHLFPGTLRRLHLFR